MNYFHSVTTVEESKKMYRQLAKQYHPDINKDASATEIMAEINSEYEATMKRLEQSTTATAAYKDMIDALIKFDDIDVEIIGTWIWVSGETRAIAKELGKEGLGFKFSKNKLAWYWHEGEYTARHKKKFSMDDIRNMHNVQTVKSTGKTTRKGLKGE